MNDTASKNTAIVLAITTGAMSVSQAATTFSVSKRWIYILLARYREQGDSGLQPRSRRPRSSPTAISQDTIATILRMRQDLQAQGLDAGARSIHARLDPDQRPSVSTIWRILKRHEVITPQPQKRPRSSWHRFVAPQPNSCWQSDFTHWATQDREDVEIISWLDDHSRFLIHISAHPRVSGRTVINTFTQAVRQYDPPASTLTDNGMVYTTRLSGGRSGNQPNGFEQLLADLGIEQKNGRPAHPTTQGKVERFQQTLKKWLRARPLAKDLEELNTQLGDFAQIYNYQRPHHALGHKPPWQVYQASPKAFPAMHYDNRPWRVRYDIVDTTGTITIRYAGKLRHLGIGRAWRRHEVIALIHGTDTIIISRTTGEIIAEHTIDPHHDYQPQKHLPPPPQTDPPHRPRQ